VSKNNEANRRRRSKRESTRAKGESGRMQQSRIEKVDGDEKW